MIQLKDQIGHELQLERPAKRIVSLVPSLSELVADLGARNQLVGLTSWCVHPKGMREEKVVIGGTKNLLIEGIKALQAELIIGNKEENVQEQVEALGDDIPVYISDVQSLADAYEMIKDIGQLIGKTPEAEVMVKEFQALEYQLTKQEALSFLYFIWKEPWMVAGKDSYISHLLELLGMRNLVPEGSGRYPSLSWEQIHKLNPDRIILSSEPYRFKSGDLRAFHEAGLRSHLVDGELFTWYGSRIGKSLRFLSKNPFLY